MGSKAEPPQGDFNEKGFPYIKLDLTINGLLEKEWGGDVKETICHFKPNADRRYSQTPFNEKFLITASTGVDGDVLAHLLLENVSNLLMFPIGPGKLAYVASEGYSKDPSLTKDAIHKTATKNFDVLTKEQRPSIVTYKNAQDFKDNHKGDPVRWGFAIDFAEAVPSIFEPELVYKINSKRWLAENSVDSARDRIIDCEAKCPDHKTKDGLWYFGGEGCKTCGEAIKDEIERVRKLLQDVPAPFVLKLTQCLGSMGTHIVQKEEEKEKVIKYITEENLPGYLRRVSQNNAHIHPTALVLSDFIKGETWALNFFIKKDGTTVFCGACNQLTTRSVGGRQSTAINYADQAQLEKKFKKTLDAIGKVLKEEGGGYYGPIGADLLVDPEDEDHFYCIDLNVRVPTSYTLYLLKGHAESRGFGVGTVFECLILGISRDELEEKFNKEFKEGRIVLLGSTKLGKQKAWAYPVILCTETRDEAMKLSKRILEYEAKGNDEDAGGG